ncbi:reverse transcriptase domain-containing protein, partial [Tanacetum coccineum]
MDKVQKYSSENTAQVPPPEDHDSIFIEIPKPMAKKTFPEPNSPEPNSYQPKLPYLERIKVREKDTPPSAQQSSRLLPEMTLCRGNIGTFRLGHRYRNAKIQQMVKHFLRNSKISENFLCALQELDRTNALADSGASINLLPHSIYKQLGLGALKPTRMTLELANRS